MARFAVLLPRNLYRGFRAPIGFLERDLEVVAQVGASLRAAATPSAAEQVAEAEHVAENVAEVAELRKDTRIESSARACGPDARMAEPVVHTALFRLGQNRVGFGGFLEFL